MLLLIAYWIPTGSSCLYFRPFAVIRGPTEQSVQSARTRLTLLEDAAIRKLDYTHFLSLPLGVGKNATHPQFKERLVAFKQKVLKADYRTNGDGIEESVFIDPNTMHLTVLMLKLYGEERKKKAQVALQVQLS